MGGRKNKRLLFIFGTRPEAIKLAMPIREARLAEGLTPRVCVTAQHRELLDQALRSFGIKAHHDLDIMENAQDLFHVTSSVLMGAKDVIELERPDMVVVQGDTTSALAGAMAAFYMKVPVAHVEAGLRTGDMLRPYPEEMNRKLLASLASIHFAPTKGASRALLNEGVPRSAIHVTGNTVVDSLHYILKKVGRPSVLRRIKGSLSPVPFDGDLVLVTGHRRESFGKGIEDLCRALKIVARENPGLTIVYPVHLNPNVRVPVDRILSGLPGVHLIEPVDYETFVFLMSRARFIITDSGGVQEEAASIGIRTLVTREVTERPEAVEAGYAKVVGTSVERICSEAFKLLKGTRARPKAGRGPFGDGKASGRVIAGISSYLESKKG